MIQHVCELSSRPENGAPFVAIKRPILKNLWKAWCGISRYTPKCCRYMHSMGAVAAERERHAGLRHWWIIHPFSYVRFLWDIFMMAVYLIACLTIPFMICFVTMDYELIQLDIVNVPIYAICWLDILLNCITGYHDKKRMQIELRPAKILESYLKGFFTLDVLSSLPYDRLTLPWRRLPGDDSHAIVTLINIMPLIKVIRYYTVNSNIYYLFMHFEIQNFYYELCITLLLGLNLIFWFSCLCYLIPILMMHFLNIPPRECKDCWMTGLEAHALSYRLKNAIFIVLENISGSGYGLFIPETDGHIILSSVYMIIGRIIFCYMLVMFLRIKAGKKASETNFQEIINQVKAYTRHKQLLPHMKRRILAHYNNRFKNSYFHERRIMSDLSESLREEIMFQSCRRLIENVAIFKNLPKNVLQSIVKNLKFELYLPNDVIVKAGSHGDCMFFISSGTVAVLTPTGREVCHLDDGAHFGEVALLVADQRRVASVVAIEICEVYRLDRKDFRQCIDVHSELFAEIERIASERMEQMVEIEEQHKRFQTRLSRVQEYLYDGGTSDKL